MNKIPRHLDRVAIKEVADALRDRPMTWSELKELGVPERTLARVLKEYLEYWGLVEKDESGRWVWKEYKKAFVTTLEYEIAMEHSRRLIWGVRLVVSAATLGDFFRKPGFGLKGEEMVRLVEAVRSHLWKEYPDVYEKMIELHRLLRERKRIGEEIRREFPKESRRVLRKFYRDEGLDFLVGCIDNFSCNLGGAVPKEYRRDIQKIAKHIPEQRTTQIKQNMALTRRINREFASEAEGIIMKIENGEPLRLGSCDLCPRIHIKQPQSVGASN